MYICSKNLLLNMIWYGNVDIFGLFLGMHFEEAGRYCSMDWVCILLVMVLSNGICLWICLLDLCSFCDR